MVPFKAHADRAERDSPRIRGDGPSGQCSSGGVDKFSPYSRGWSPVRVRSRVKTFILPVFAEMVPVTVTYSRGSPYSPRIRGDGPGHRGGGRVHQLILPVFAGMVPRGVHHDGGKVDSPRIRGDGPSWRL